MRLPDAFEAYEAPNEYDLSGDSEWVSTLRATLARLHQLKSYPESASFPISGPHSRRRLPTLRWATSAAWWTSATCTTIRVDGIPAQAAGETASAKRCVAEAPLRVPTVFFSFFGRFHRSSDHLRQVGRRNADVLAGLAAALDCGDAPIGGPPGSHVLMARRSPEGQPHVYDRQR